MKKVAVIGAGYWGKNLVRNFYELEVLEKIYDPNPSIQEKFSQIYSKEIVALDLHKDIFSNSSIKGIVIATPAPTHFELAKKAILSGKDVFVEKPLCLDIEEATELVALAEEYQKILMVGHVLHYHPAIVKLKEIIAQEELGEINYIYSNRLSWGKVRSEENVLWSFAPHDLSLVIGLMNSSVDKASSFGIANHQKGIEDIVISNLEFENGKKSHVFVSWQHPFKEQRLVVIGSEKIAVFDDTKSWDQKLALYNHTVQFNEFGLDATKGDCFFVECEEKEPLKEECKAFLNAIQNRENPITDGKEGLGVLRVLKKLSS